MDQDLKCLLESCWEIDTENFKRNLAIRNTVEYEFLYGVANVINNSIINSNFGISFPYFADFSRYFILGINDILRNHINSASTNFRHSQEAGTIFIYILGNQKELKNLNDGGIFLTQKGDKLKDKSYKYFQREGEKNSIFNHVNQNHTKYKKFLNDHLSHGSSHVKNMNYTLNYTNNSIEMGYCDSRKVIDDLYSRFIFLSARMGINMLELIQLLMIKSNLDPTFSKNMKLLQSKKDEAKSFIYK